MRIQRSTKSHSTLAALWKQSDLSCGGCSRPSRPGEPLPAHDETHGHGQCNCERKASPTPCFPLGGIFLRAVSGFSLARKCLCFSPPPLLTYGSESERPALEKQRAPNGTSLSLSRRSQQDRASLYRRRKCKSTRRGERRSRM